MKNDLISRQAVKDIFTELYGISAIGSVFDKHEWKDICETTANELPSIQPDIIRCKDCKHSRFFEPCFYCYEMGGEIIVPENGFCFKAERREDEAD